MNWSMKWNNCCIFERMGLLWNACIYCCSNGKITVLNDCLNNKEIAESTSELDFFKNHTATSC